MKLKALALSALLLGAAGSSLAQEADDMYFFTSDRAKLTEEVSVKIDTPDEASKPVQFDGATQGQSGLVSNNISGNATVQQNFYFNGVSNPAYSNYSLNRNFAPANATLVYSSFGRDVYYNNFTGRTFTVFRNNNWAPAGYGNSVNVSINSGWNSWNRPSTIGWGSGWGGTWGGGAVVGNTFGGTAVNNAWCPPSSYGNGGGVINPIRTPRATTASTTPRATRATTRTNSRVYAPRSSRGGTRGTTTATRANSVTRSSATTTRSSRSSSSSYRGSSTSRSGSSTYRSGTRSTRSTGTYRAPSRSSSSRSSSGSYRSSSPSRSSSGRSSGGSRSSSRSSSSRSSGRGGR